MKEMGGESEYVPPGYKDKRTYDWFKQLDRLCAEGIEAAEKIENGVDTSAVQLDRLLQNEVDLNYLVAHHDSPMDMPNEPSDREEAGVHYLKYKRILEGSYHKEKADYCHEQYIFHRGKAEESEQRLAAGEIKPGYEDYARQVSARSRKWAANWLRTEANCLEMPEGKPQAPPPYTNH